MTKPQEACPGCHRAASGVLRWSRCPKVGQFWTCLACGWSDYDDRWEAQAAPWAVEGQPCDGE